MSEEMSSPEARKEPRPVSRGQQRRRQRSVFQYIAVLFAAAFLLLLYTFAMERRQNELLQQQNQEQQADLQKSVSAVQTLEGLLEENENLKQRVRELEDSVEGLESRADQYAQDLSRQQSEAELAAEAMDWFWQINEAYVRGQKAKCRDLIAALEEKSLQEHLSTQSVTDNGRFSPYDRYMEIREKVL